MGKAFFTLQFLPLKIVYPAHMLHCFHCPHSSFLLKNHLKTIWHGGTKLDGYFPVKKLTIGCVKQGTQSQCTGKTLRDGMGREVAGGVQDGEPEHMYTHS